MARIVTDAAFLRADGLHEGRIGEVPVGLASMGRPFSEGDLFRVVCAFEQATRHRLPLPGTPLLTR